MDIKLLEEFEKKALLWAEGFGCNRDKFQYHSQIKGYYHFPEKNEEDNLTILVIEMIPDLAGYWDCWDVTSIEDCSYLSKETPHAIFEKQPNCNNGKYCFAEKRESFVIVYEISNNEIDEINHHHIGDFQSEYVDKNDDIENYRVGKQDILKLNLPDYCQIF